MHRVGARGGPAVSKRGGESYRSALRWASRLWVFHMLTGRDRCARVPDYAAKVSL